MKKDQTVNPVTKEEEGFDSDESLISEEDENKWNKILLREEFLYLYFNSLGLNENLAIQKIVEFSQINNKNNNKENFKFAIVKTKMTENPIIINSKEDETKEIIKDHKIILAYPNQKEQATIEDSVNFLSMAFSGFMNSYLSNEKSSLFSNKKTKFMEFMKKLKHESEKGDFKFFDPYTNYKTLKKNKEFQQEHNNITQQISDYRLENILRNLEQDMREDQSNLDEQKSRNSYSIFFIKDGILFEYKGNNGKLKVISRFATSSNARETLNGYLKEEIIKGKEYLQDMIIFSEILEEEKISIDTKSEGFLIIFLISIIFVVNNFMINPESIFYQLKKGLSSFLELDENGVSKIDGNIYNYKDLRKFFNNEILNRIYTKDNNFTFVSQQSVFNDIANVVQQGSSNVYNFNQLKPNRTNYYILNTNYLSGMMINYRTSKIRNKADYSSKNYTIRNTSLEYYESVPYLSTSINNSNLINPLYPDTFKLYLKPSLNKIQLEWFRDQVNSVFTEDIYEFSYTILLYNYNYQALVLYSGNFKFDSYGEMSYSTKYQGFLPFINEMGSKFTILIVLNIIYLIGLTYVTFLVARSLSHAFSDFIYKNTYSFEWYDYVDVLVLVICFVSMVMGYGLLIFRQRDFKISISYEEDFIYWVYRMLDMKSYLTITGIAMFLLFIRIIRFLYSSFPTFGIVFQTYTMAYKEILSFMCIILTMIVIISFMSHISFGWYSEQFTIIDNSFIYIFLMFTGFFDYKDFYNLEDYNIIAPFFVIFFIFYYTIIIQLFLCIIRVNYFNIKEKKESFNKIITMIISEDTHELRKKIYNFVACRDPIKCEEEDRNADIKNNDKESLSVTVLKQDVSNINLNNEKQVPVNYNNPKESNLWEIIKYNIKRIYIKVTEKNAWERDGFETRKVNKFKLILKNNISEALDDIETDYESNFDLMTEFCIFSFYIIIYVSMVFIEFKFNESGKIDNYIKQYFEQYSPRGSIRSWEPIKITTQNFITDLYKLNNTYCDNIKSLIKYQNIVDSNSDNMVTPPGNDSSINSDLADFINLFFYNDQNVIQKDRISYYNFLTSPYLRLTLRKYSYVKNIRTSDSEYFGYLLADPTPLTETYCNSNSEQTTDIIRNLQEDSSKKRYKYPYSLGLLDNTPNECGGYVFLVNETSPYCPFNNETKLVLPITDNIQYFLTQIFDEYVASYIVDTALIPLFHHYIIYVKIIFEKDILGNIKGNLIVLTIPINLIHKKEDLNRVLILLSFCFLTLYYIVDILRQIAKIIGIYIERDFYENVRDREKFKNIGLLSKLMRYDFEKFKNETLMNFLMSIIYFIIVIISKLIFYTILAFYNFLKNGLFNIIDTISLALSIYQMIFWIEIYLLTDQLNVKSKKTLNHEDPDPIGRYNINIASNLEIYFKSYLILASVNGFLIIMRFIKYFRFSKQIYSMINSLIKSRDTIAFHLLIVFFINLGFILMSHSIFGQNVLQYSTIANITMEILIILSGKINIDSIYETDNYLATIYVLMISLINYLILFNFLAAIIVEGYRDLKLRQEQNNSDFVKLNFFSNLVSIASNKFRIFGIRVELFVLNIKNLDEKIEKECGKKFNETLINIEEEEKKKDKSSFLENLSLKINLYRLYNLDLLERLDDCMQKTMDAEFYPGTVDETNEDKFKFVTFIKNHYKKVAKTTKEISISTKIFAFIMTLVNENALPRLKKMFEKTNCSIGNTKTVLFNGLLSKINMTTYNNDDKNFVNETYKQLKTEAKVKNINKWIAALKINFKEYFRIKESSYFPTNTLDKRKPKYVSKYTDYEFELNSYNQIYEIENVNSIDYYNTDFRVYCQNHPFCLENKATCRCEFIGDYFKSIAVAVYDTFIKHFHIPSTFNPEDRYVLLGYHVEKLLKRYRNTEEYLKMKLHPLDEEIKTKRSEKESEFKEHIANKLCKIKIILFEADIKKISNHDKLEKLSIFDLIDDKDKLLNNNKFTNSHSPTNEFLNKLDELKKLYKFLTIWNTLYMILFKKNSFQLLELKKLTKSYELFKECSQAEQENMIEDKNLIYLKEKNSKKYINYYEAIIKIYFDLEKPHENFNSSYEYYKDFLEKFKQRHRLYVLDYNRTHPTIIFFEDQDKYLLTEENESFKEVLPNPQKIDREDSMNLTNIPEIFLKLWRTLNVSEKFFLYFGFNKYVLEEVKLSNFLKNEFLNENWMKIEVHVMFKSHHQAELLKLLKFPKFFDVLLIEKLKIFIEVNKINDDNKINDIFTTSQVLSYFHEMRINYVKYYDFVTKILDNFLKPVKYIIRDLRNEFKHIFRIIWNNNIDILTNDEEEDTVERKLQFIKFFKLYLCKAKFDRINLFFDSMNKEEYMDKTPIDEDKNNEDENEPSSNNSFNIFENFLYVCTIGPIELLGIIKSLDDIILRDFYLFLFLYLHHDDEDFPYFIGYIKKNLKVDIIEKYHKFSEYIIKREETLVNRDDYLNEKHYNETAIDYIKTLKKTIHDFENIKENLLNKIGNKIEEEEAKFKNNNINS